MLRLLCRQVLFALITILIAITVLFFLVEINSDSFVASRLGLESNEELRFVVKTEYQLNLPLEMRFVKFFSRVLTLRLFVSNATNASILPGLLKDLAGSLTVALIGIALATLVAIFIALVSVHTKNKYLEYFCRLFGTLGLSMPEVNFALFFHVIFRTSLLGLVFLGLEKPMFSSPLFNRLVILALPVTFLVMKLFATSFRYIRAEMLHVMNQEFIMAEKSRGLSKMRIYLGSVLRNSYVAIIPSLGVLLLEAINSLIILEMFFPTSRFFKGFIQAAFKQDTYLIIAHFTLVIVAVVLVSWILDFFLALTNPRISYH